MPVPAITLLLHFLITMKIIRLFLLFTMIILLSKEKLSAQAFFKAEMIGGFNMSQVNGDETAGFRKFGLNTGLGVVMPVYKNWSLSFETIYTRKGSRLSRQYYTDSLDGSYSLKLNYAEVPFLVIYTDRNFMSAGVGASWGRLVSVSERERRYRNDTVTFLKGPYSKNDFQVLADVRFRLYKNFRFNARYALSVKQLASRNIIDSSTGRLNQRGFYNSVVSFRLIYTINESAPDKIKKSEPTQ